MEIQHFKGREEELILYWAATFRCCSSGVAENRGFTRTLAAGCNHHKHQSRTIGIGGPALASASRIYCKCHRLRRSETST